MFRTFHKTEVRYSVISRGNGTYAITDKWWHGQSGVFRADGRKCAGRLCLGRRKAQELIDAYNNSTWEDETPSLARILEAMGAA